MNPRYERWRWVTFATTWLIYAGFYFTRQAFGVAKVDIQSDPRVTLDRDDLGLVDSYYLTTYMLGQFVFGPLGDRFGPRRILLFGLGLSALAAIGSGFSTGLTAFLAFAVVQGIAQATGWSNTSKVMSSWFSVPERGRIIGWWCTHYTVGYALALALAGWATQHFRATPAESASGSAATSYWPAAFWATAAVVAVVMAVAWVLLRARPEDVGLPPIEEYHGEPTALLASETPADVAVEGSWKVIGQVLSSPSIWMLAIAYFPIKLARYSFAFWGPKYVHESLGVGVEQSALTAAAMPIGGLVGVIAIGYVSDRVFQSRRAPAIVLSLLATAAIIFMGLEPIHNIWVMAAFLFFVGAFLYGPDSTISATAAMDFGTKRGAGTATGFVNGVGSVGAILGGILPGKITTAADWTPLFFVMLGGLILSALLLLPLWNTKPPTK